MEMLSTIFLNKMLELSFAFKSLSKKINNAKNIVIVPDLNAVAENHDTVIYELKLF